MIHRRLIATGILLGIGLGGFLDGIFFHQIFQIHNMISAKLPPDSVINIKTNMFWDGLFHSMTWLATTISLVMLWNILKRNAFNLSGRTLAGSAILGWGIFNLTEGLIDHFVMDVHHVVQNLGRSWYDYLFLASGLIFILTGYLIIRRSNIAHQKSTISSLNSGGHLEGGVIKDNNAYKKRLILPGFIMGMGLGGILEGILFFQVFQLHNMVSAVYPQNTIENIRKAMVFDGLYHLFTWTIIVTAISLLWRRWKKNRIYLSGQTYIASALAGLAILNITEGIIDHHIFQIHHVVERLGLSVYDYIFLGASMVIAVVSLLLVRNKVKARPANLSVKQAF